ncbi:MAG: isopropylmalate/homocitrate/citramalate synthase [Bacillota bacterium]|nr:isopropylmalate/homocitrate/citramalate synthase [Bacillota bacterium]
MKKKCFLTDTTLRDGEQSPRLCLSPGQKKGLAVMLDQLGFYQIEAGIPAMGTFEKDIILEIIDVRKQSKISVWNRMDKTDIRHSFDCNPDVIHISVPVSDGMIYTMLRQSRSWVSKTMNSCVSFAREQGYEVSVGFQDASRADISFLASLTESLQRMQVSSVRIADTVGILTPTTARKLVCNLKEHTDILLGIHTHNDLGMAEAVALEAAKSGAELVDVTLFGVGERAGNCDSFVFTKAAEPLFDFFPAYQPLMESEAKMRRLIF